MDKKDFSNLGEDIWYTVQDAFNTMDFTKLKEEIKYTAESTFNEVKRNFNMNNNPSDSYDYNRKTSNYESNSYGRETNSYEYKRDSYDYSKQDVGNNQGVQNYTRNQLDIARKPAGSVSGILYMVFGFIGTGIFGILLIVQGILNLFFSSFTTLNAISFGLLALLFGSSLLTGLKGVKVKKRIGRFKKYVRQLGSRSFCTVKELASHIGETEKYVVKDLRKMIDLGMFPKGHIDEQKTCLLLNNEVYGQYLNAMEAKKKREQEEINKKKAEEEKAKDPSNKDLREAIESGRNYIRQIREANDAIPGEEISRKLDRLEKITEKIFNYVEKHPEQLPELHKLMNYYLPITLKLVNTYKDLDAEPVQGANIMTAKSEIEDTLDTISIAYEKLLDDLFHDIAFDISTDISMLETMLSKEGLTDNGFKK